MDEQISLLNVSKRYGNHRVLSNITLSVNPGECIALIGMNGCGKSTLLRIVGGLTAINSGNIRRRPALNMQYMPEYFPRLNITLGQFIKHIERIGSTDTGVLLQMFHLDNAINVPLNSFSKGMLSKVSAIQALSANPDLLLLDEPLSGQDLASQAVFITYIQEMKKHGISVLMACHEQTLVDMLADRVYQIEDGSLLPIQKENRDAECICHCNGCELNGSNRCPRKGGNS